MQLELVSRLPKDSRVVLEVPRDFAERLQIRPVSIGGRKDDNVAHVAVKASGRSAFAELIFPAKARIPMRLLVQVSKEHRNNEYEIFVRQLYEKNEVGRVTWRMSPLKSRDKQY
jgi:hypothetical protein